MFLGIGLVLLPISLLVTLLQALVIGTSRIAGISTEGESGGLLVFLVFLIGTALTLLGLGLVIAATARALVEIDQGRPIGPIGAYRLAFDSARPLFGAVLIAVAAISLLVQLRGARPDRHLAGSPLVARGFRRRARGLLSDRGAAPESPTRPATLAEGRLLTVFGAVLALVLGPLIGVLLILLTSAPLSVLNLVAGVVNAVTMPFVALTTAYVYFDARARVELEPADEPAELPAEFQLSG